MSNNKKTKNKGFTLIEIIAVVIIIGIIALIAVPSVSGYIANSRNTTYKAHEKTMEEAAQSLTIEVINGKESFSLPKKGDHAEVFLNELVDKEYLESLKDPSTGELCNESMSYVIIKNVGSSNYEYKSCLYCGTYITESDECSAPSVDDNEKPVCGMITGESSEWTNKSRTITVACSDAGSGCTRNKFTKVFNTTTDKGFVQISDKSGKTEDCQVNVRVDRTEPMCELIAEGDENIETTGWSSGRTVVVKYKDGSRKDEHSGMLTYGIGTSLKNRNYNKKESYEINNLSGTTTVIGYVKDNAGNEGVCYKTVTTGLERPIFDVRYGYQIYPLKERFELSGATQSGDNKITTTTTTPSITFKNMNKYQDVTAVIMELTSGVSDPSLFKLVVGGNTYSGSSDNASNSRIRFYIETEPALNTVSSQSDYKITLGNRSGVTYTITRIELEQKSGNISSKHNVAVNLITRKAVVKTTNWIWNDGNAWENQYYKLFDPTTGTKSGNARIKNDIPLTSDPVAYSIGTGDATLPTITITSGNTDWTNQDITLTGKVKDTGTGIIGYMWSTSNNVHYYDSGWQYYDSPTTDEKTYTYTATKNGTYYLYAKDESGNVSKNSITVTNIDKLAPTCNAISNQATTSCSEKAATTDYGKSQIVKYYFGTKSNPSDSEFTNVTAADTYGKTETVTNGNGTTYYVFVIDKAGNRSEVKSDIYYTVTYKGNGAGATVSKASEIRRNNTAATLTYTATRTGYTFLGWHTNSSSTSALTSHTVTGNTDLHAVWRANTYSISYSLDGGSYGSSHPTTATYDSAFTVNNPSKSVTVSFSLGSSGASATTTAKTGSYTFNGWKITGMDSVTHTYGGSTTTSTSISSTTATSFKNLRSTSGTVTFSALWAAPTITLPAVTRTGYTCKWNNGSSSWVSEGTYKPSDSGGTTAITMTASCTPNTYTVNFNGNGCGTPNKSSMTVTYDSTYNPLATISRTGFRFDGWYTAASGGSLVTNSTTVKITSTQTLFAHCTDLCNSKAQSCTTAWNGWGGCSASCGGGSQSRTGTQTCKDGYGTGYVCSTTTVSGSQSCNTQGCCSSTYISGYGGWSGCSASCGGGIQTRAIYYTSNYNGQSCGSGTDSRSCNTQSCCSPTGGGSRCGSGWAGHDCGTGAHWVSDGYHCQTSKPSCCSTGCAKCSNGKYKVYDYKCVCD